MMGNRHSDRVNRLAAVLVAVVASLAMLGAAKEEKVVVPNIIVTSLGDYAFQGAGAAVTAWVKGSSMEGSPEAAIQVNYLRQVESVYGKFQSYHLIQVNELSRLTSIVYLSINYEKGPLFARFLAYRIRDGWILPDFSFNIKPEAILPPDLLAQ